jgi:hypothetical protein
MQKFEKERTKTIASQEFSYSKKTIMMHEWV